MRKKETEERIRLLEYENMILTHELNAIKDKLSIPIPPMMPFDRIEIHSMGCSWSLPSYEDLKIKYKR